MYVIQSTIPSLREFVTEAGCHMPPWNFVPQCHPHIFKNGGCLFFVHIFLIIGRERCINKRGKQNTNLLIDFVWNYFTLVAVERPGCRCLIIPLDWYCEKARHLGSFGLFRRCRCAVVDWETPGILSDQLLNRTRYKHRRPIWKLRETVLSHLIAYATSYLNKYIYISLFPFLV